MTPPSFLTARRTTRSAERFEGRCKNRGARSPKYNASALDVSLHRNSDAPIDATAANFAVLNHESVFFKQSYLVESSCRQGQLLASKLFGFKLHVRQKGRQ